MPMIKDSEGRGGWKNPKKDKKVDESKEQVEVQEEPAPEEQVQEEVESEELTPEEYVVDKKKSKGKAGRKKSSAKN